MHTGGVRKKRISKGNCMGRVIITTVTRQQPSFTYLSFTRDDDDDDDAFDQDYNEDWYESLWVIQ